MILDMILGSSLIKKLFQGGGGEKAQIWIKAHKKKHHIKTHLILYSDLKF